MGPPNPTEEDEEEQEEEVAGDLFIIWASINLCPKEKHNVCGDELDKSNLCV